MSVRAHDRASYRTRDVIPARRALLSLSDKRGLEPFARALHQAGVEIVSTGSTAATIRDAGIPVTEVAELTGFPESLDGRVKTLHPVVHAGLLADLRLAHHETQLAELGIAPFELVALNLYPFTETVESGADAQTVIENIDIGGPAMLRSAAKNHANVAIVTSPDDYEVVAGAVAGGGTDLALRRELALKAFAHVADYDAAVADWFADHVLASVGVDAQGGAESGGAGESDVDRNAEAEASLPEQIVLDATRESVLRYGENAHQAAGLYRFEGGRGIAQAEVLHGKPMSFNNYVDGDAAVRAAFDFAEPAVAIIKHANPCGIALAAPGLTAPEAIADAHRRAHECDPLSAYGGIIAANREVSREMAETVKGIFTEAVIAPSFAPEALELLRTKKHLRLLTLPDGYTREGLELRHISGGMLVQEPDRFDVSGRALDEDASGWTLASGEPADAATLRDLAFAWRACRAVKSNAILLARDGASVGIGMGQVNRVDSCRLAVQRAGDRAAGSVAASDAFFPFADGLELLVEAGVRAVVQPGGSVRDEEVIAAARAAGVTMYFTGERHFAH